MPSPYPFFAQGNTRLAWRYADGIGLRRQTLGAIPSASSARLARAFAHGASGAWWRLGFGPHEHSVGAVCCCDGQWRYAVRLDRQVSCLYIWGRWNEQGRAVENRWAVQQGGQGGGKWRIGEPGNYARAQSQGAQAAKRMPHSAYQRGLTYEERNLTFHSSWQLLCVAIMHQMPPLIACATSEMPRTRARLR